MSKQRMLLTASSLKSGLTFYLSRLAINLKRKGHDVIVISDFREEINGLSDKLKSERIEHYRIKGFDSYINLKSAMELSKVMKIEDFDIIARA